MLNRSPPSGSLSRRFLPRKPAVDPIDVVWRCEVSGRKLLHRSRSSIHGKLERS
jgi:hypothetical protein